MSEILLVTGGSRGIGAATCRRAANDGYAVAVNYRKDQQAAEQIVQHITSAGGKAIAVQADVGNEADIVRMFAEVSDRLGAPTALVNSAGVGGKPMAIKDFDAQTLGLLMHINIVGTMLCCKHAVRYMSTSLGGKGGSVVNISSMAGTIGGRPNNSAYAASKAAVDSFTVGFAKEVGLQGMRVNSVRPGATITDMTSAIRDNEDIRRKISATIAMNKIAEPDEMAAPIMWLLSKEASYISGCTMDASGGGFLLGSHMATE